MSPAVMIVLFSLGAGIQIKMAPGPLEFSLVVGLYGFFICLDEWILISFLAKPRVRQVQNLYKSSRLPAPHFSALFPAHEKLQSDVEVGTLPTWSELPQ